MTHDAHAAQPQLQEYTLPPAEALLAGTLALMTCHDQAAVEGRDCPALAGKVAANLHVLARHPALSPCFRSLMDQLRERWEAQCDEPVLRRVRAEAAAAWLPTPGALQ
jgi:hypothetical protein